MKQRKKCSFVQFFTGRRPERSFSAGAVAAWNYWYFTPLTHQFGDHNHPTVSAPRPQIWNLDTSFSGQSLNCPMQDGDYADCNMLTRACIAILLQNTAQGRSLGQTPSQYPCVLLPVLPLQYWLTVTQSDSCARHRTWQWRVQDFWLWAQAGAGVNLGKGHKLPSHEPRPQVILLSFCSFQRPLVRFGSNVGETRQQR